MSDAVDKSYFLNALKYWQQWLHSEYVAIVLLLNSPQKQLHRLVHLHLLDFLKSYVASVYLPVGK
jgi:FMN phosphatase YigB (HAD superfamily)